MLQSEGEISAYGGPLPCGNGLSGNVISENQLISYGCLGSELQSFTGQKGLPACGCYASHRCTIRRCSGAKSIGTVSGRESKKNM